MKLTNHAASDRLFTFRFRAMNTSIACTLAYESEEQADRLRRDAVSWFRYAEEKFSRFLPTSELVYLNRRAGADCLVSSAMLEVLQLAETYRRRTDGAFNPFILDALERCGYEDSFERLALADFMTACSPRELPALSADELGMHAIAINPRMKSVKLPAGTSIDLGGIVKSWAVRRLADWLRRKQRVTSGLVNAGGDLAAWSDGPGGDDSSEGRPWRIGIEHPRPEAESSHIGMLSLVEGAAATSSTLGRRWQTAAGPMHHLIDPVTLLPAESDIVQCTVSGGDPVACEVWAKTLCILGSASGIALLARKQPPIEALLFGRDREILFYGAAASIGSKWRDVPVTRLITARSTS
ncbi:FAD:protein FMN transferase [Paenibacillus sacheonensis]|uniref:FAD:protein FMN transferase n=1 Tax=Paenibacillus sacheonensis TaxID=742054 RepID=A0A7X4YQD6_9BACL|nr:FAD:protein FMN transferase [Paenibacillus sacheonensis]MBM7566643.1 thiamine biosynthesis lipoprotein [Paenibacillus sacheonensis]NBC70625.1 hypothetical protein [Paenibacillus sacheonensis]